RSPEDARAVRAFRAAARQSGVPKDTIEQCISWYDGLGSGASRDPSVLMTDFAHFAERRGFDPAGAMQAYSAVAQYGVDRYLPSAGQDGEIIRRAEQLLREDADAYWHPDMEADREAYTEALERRAAGTSPAEPDGLITSSPAYRAASAKHNATRRAEIEGW